MRAGLLLSLCVTLMPITVVWAAQNDPRVRLEEPERGERRFTAPAAIPIEAKAHAARGRTIARVEFFADGQRIGEATAAPYAMTWPNVPEGEYRLRARATDNRGATDWSPRVQVRVRENREPKVRLTAPHPGQKYVASATIELRAQARDRDHNLARVEFYANGVLLGTDTTPRFRFTWTGVTAGTYNVMARAVDALGATDDSRVVTIVVTGNQNQAPSVSLTSPSAGSVFPAPGTVTLTANAADADGTIAKVDFYQGPTLVGTATAAPYATTVTNLAAGAYSFTAVATDNQGAGSTSAPVTVTVNVNALPTVAITSPVNNATFTALANIPLTAEVADADGSIAMVEFFNGASLIATSTVAPYSIIWTEVPQGAYTLTARVTDNQGAAVTSAAVAVTVNAAVAQMYFIHTDHLNTPRAIYNQSQQLVWRWDQTDPFGGTPPNENPSGLGGFTCNLRFPGQYFDKETNLHYNYFRDYEPGIGRYIQSDPIGLEGGVITYTYAFDPLTQIDPLGLMGQGSGAAVAKPQSGPARFGGGGGAISQECVQNYLNNYYGGIAANSLVPNFSLLSYIPSNPNSSQAATSTLVGLAIKGVVIPAAVYGGVGLVGTGTAFLSAGARSVSAYAMIGGGITLASLGFAATGTAAVGIPFTTGYATAANVMAIQNCRCQ